MTEDRFELGGAAVRPGERGLARLPVTGTLHGGTVDVAVHIVRGARPGPTLGLLAGVHGDEILPLQVFRELLAEVDPRSLGGTLLVVPVANPLALAAFQRETPELHINTDLHQVFPGSATGTLTQMIAWTLSQQVLNRVDALIDFHAGGVGGRLQNRVDFHLDVQGALRERCVALCRAVGSGAIQENNLARSAVAYVTGRGVPGINIEIGGAYLPRALAGEFARRIKRGVRNVMGHLGMLDGVSPPTKPQLLFGPKQRVEVNPKTGGYLHAEYGELEHLGWRIPAGTSLGTVFDCHTLAEVERLVAPVEGILFFNRHSGVLEAGSKGFALAQIEGATWV